MQNPLFYSRPRDVPRVLLDGREAWLRRRDHLPRLLPHADAHPPGPGEEAVEVVPKAAERRLPVGGILRGERLAHVRRGGGPDHGQVPARPGNIWFFLKKIFF